LLAAAEPSAENGGEELAQWLVGGTRLLAFAWQEQVAEIEPAALPACRVEGGVLTGRKQFVSGCENDSVLLVSASVNGQPAIVAVAADAPGVHIERFASGIGAQAHVSFDSAPLLFAEPLLSGVKATEVVLQVLAAGRVSLAAELAGKAAGCLHQTVEY